MQPVAFQTCGEHYQGLPMGGPTSSQSFPLHAILFFNVGYSVYNMHECI